MGKTHCIILSEDQLLLAKADLLDQAETRALFKLREGYDEDELAVGRNVVLRIYDTQNGLRTYRGSIARLSGDSLQIASFTVETNEERRDDVKVIVNREVFIIYPKAETGELRKTSASLRDISAGGVGLVTREDLPEGVEFEMVFDLEKDVDVLQVQAIRKQKTESGEFSYGCLFVDLHPTQESRVREYVFKKHLGLIGRPKTKS